MAKRARDEGLTEQVKVMFSRSQLRDLQDLALAADRSVSEYIRHVLGLHQYGHTAIIQGRREKATDCES